LTQPRSAVIESLDLIILVLNSHRPAGIALLSKGTSLHNPFTLTQPVPVISIERMHEEFDYNE
jgi:hypothetical protein